MRTFVFRAQLISVLLMLPFISGKTQVDTSKIQLVSTIQLPNVTGRLGHMAYNHKQQVVYLAALSNNTLEVVDIQNKKVIKSVKSLRQPIDVEYVAAVDRFFVACLGDGLCRAFNASNYNEENSYRFENNVSIVKYSPVLQMLYIGFGDGGIAVIDGNSMKYKMTIKLTVHPEALCFDENAGKMYINLAKSREIGVIDLKNNAVEKTYPLKDVAENFPIAYDPHNKRLFIGCRKPSKLLVVNAENGNTVASVNIDEDVNEIFYDQAKKQIIVNCGEGYLHLIKQEVKEVKQLISETTKQTPATKGKPAPKAGQKTKNAKTAQKPVQSKTTEQPRYRTIMQDTYATDVRIFTGDGARTSFFLPDTRLLIVAAPANAGNEARLLIYKVK